MSSSEYPRTGDNAYQIAEELRQTFSINRQPYSNIVLATTHPDFVDTYDPDIVVEREALTLYWPSGSPVHDRHFETISLQTSEEGASTAELAAETSAIREAILGASIGEAALGRVPAEMREYWEDFKTRHIAPILFARDSCALLGLPLALCQTSRILRSELAPVGARMMHLWYPEYVSPKPVLATLKKVVRDVIAEETIEEAIPDKPAKG